MVAAHADPVDNKFIWDVATVATNEWYHFISDITIIILLTTGTICWMDTFIRPGLIINAIHREHLDPPRLDKLGARGSHTSIFKLIKATRLRREDKHWLAIKAIHLNFHILPQARTPPLVIFDLHIAP